MSLKPMLTTCRRGEVLGLFFWRRLCGLQKDYLGWDSGYLVDVHGVLENRLI